VDGGGALLTGAKDRRQYVLLVAGRALQLSRLILLLMLAEEGGGGVGGSGQSTRGVAVLLCSGGRRNLQPGARQELRAEVLKADRGCVTSC
jgi:hypothetical protein